VYSIYCSAVGALYITISLLLINDAICIRSLQLKIYAHLSAMSSPACAMPFQSSFVSSTSEQHLLIVQYVGVLFYSFNKIQTEQLGLHSLDLKGVVVYCTLLVLFEVHTHTTIPNRQVEAAYI